MKTSYKEIIIIIRKDTCDEVRHYVTLNNKLRKEQSEFEDIFLEQVNEDSRPYGAAELISLYHFAKSIDVLGQYLMEGRPIDPETQLKYNLQIAGEYAHKYGNISLSLLYQFFKAFAVKMTRNTN